MEPWETQKPVLVTTNAGEEAVKNQKPVLVQVRGGLGPQLVRLQYDDEVLGAPNNTKVRQFVIDSGYTEEDKWGQILVVIKSTKITWTYVQVSPTTKEWVGGGTDVVSPFNNTRQGTIIGHTGDGYVEHLATDSDGFGHVHGFENKLNKSTDASVVYINNSSKTPTTLAFDQLATQRSIVQRDANGRIYTGSATSDSHAVNLSQMTGELNKKVDKLKTTSGNQIYARKAGVEGSYDVSDYSTANTIALRYSDGRLSVGNPVSAKDALNLEYFDDHFKYIGYAYNTLKGIFAYTNVTYKDTCGFDFSGNGAGIKTASEDGLTNRKAIWTAASYGAITTGNYDSAVKHALVDTAGSTYSDAEKTSATNRIGAVRKKLSTDGKTYLYAFDNTDSDKAIALDSINQYQKVSSFASPLVGNTHVYYYLDTDYVTAGKTYKVGNYIFDGSDFVLVADVGGGGSSAPLYLGVVAPGGSLPVKRPDGSDLVIGDYVKPKADATFPYTVGSITFKSPKDTAVFMSAPNNWLLNASIYQKTSDTPVYDQTNESIDGSGVYQADINKQNATAINGAATDGTFSKPAAGQIKINLKNRKGGVVLDATISNIVFEEDTQTLKNKTIDADLNTISNLETDNLKSSIFDTTELYTANHTHMASSKLIAKAIEDSKRGFTFTGYVTSSTPTGTIREGELWYNTTSTEMPTTFPINVYKYTNGAWSSTTEAYTPKSLDLWSNKNNGHGYYYFGNAWKLLDFNVGVDNSTIDYNNANQLEIKDEGITLPKFATRESTDANKVYSIDTNGKTILRRVNQYKEVGTFENLQGDVYTEYYLNAACVVGTQTYGVGVYIWDPIDGFIMIANTGGGGSVSTPIFVGIVPPDGSFPTTRGDGSALIVGDYVKPKQDADFPYTVAGVTFNSYKDTAVYMSEDTWLINASVYQKTNETPIASKANESIFGSDSTALYQSDINKENATSINAAAYSGTFEKETATGNIKLTIKNRKDAPSITGTIEHVVYTEDTQTLKNKTINADDNTISELELDNFKTGVVQNEVRDKDNATDTSISTEKAVRTELDKLKIQVTIMPSAGADLAGRVYEYIGATTTNYTQGYFYICIPEGTGYKWVNLPTSPVFEDVTALPSTNIKNNIIYRMHSLSVIKGKYDMLDPSRYVVSTAGITDNLSGDTTPWVLVSSQWASKWQLLVKANDTSGVITKYEVEGSTYVIDSLSYVVIDKYSLFHYIDGTWHAVGSGAGGGSDDYLPLDNKPQLNTVTLQGNKTSFETKIFWSGTQSEYDAITSKYSATAYFIDDGTGSIIASPTYTKDEVNALLLLKQNVNDTALETVNKQIVPAINELHADVRAIAGGITIKVVDTQPTTPSNNTIYYIGTAAPYVVKLYTITSGWTDLGTSEIDLTDYQKKEVTITDYTANTVEGILTEIKTLLNEKLTANDVINNLTSTETNKALSAYQGNLLAAQVNLRVKTEDIIDALDSTSTIKPLSANQGRALKEIIDTKQNKVTISPADPTGGVDGDLWFKTAE